MATAVAGSLLQLELSAGNLAVPLINRAYRGVDEVSYEREVHHQLPSSLLTLQNLADDLNSRGRFRRLDIRYKLLHALPCLEGETHTLR